MSLTDTTVGSLLAKLNVNPTIAASVAPQIILRPRVTGFLTAPVVILLRHIQMYAGIPVSGTMDEATEQFIVEAVGPAWVDTTWAEIVQDILIYKIPAKPGRRSMMSGFSGFSGFSGLSGMDSTSWCSSQNPQPGCSALTEVCKPMDARTLAVYKDLQTQVNRLLARSGKPLVRVDGRIGSETKRGINSVYNANFSSCDKIAERADEIAIGLKMQADALGAPVVAPPATSRPSVPAPSGEIIHPQEASMLGGGNMLWMFLAGGALLYFFSDEAKATPRRKRTTRRATRRSPTRRRRRAAR